MVKSALMKKRVYPRPHVMENKFRFNLGSTSQKHSTMVPLIMYDEGLGDPASYNAHPEHASFASYVGPNCYPESVINKMKCYFDFTLLPDAWNVDKVEEVRCLMIPIYGAFKETWDAIDEVTQLEVKDVLRIQHESTDRQAYPLYSATDLTGDFTTLGDDVPGLNTTQNIEILNSFDVNTYYDALQYLTIAGKLKKVTGRPKWVHIKKGHTTRVYLPDLVNPSVKRMNPYALCSVLLYAPSEDELNQLAFDGMITDTNNHIQVKYVCRYLEWNENFDMTRV